MAKNTDIQLRNQVIYSIYVRNHTKEGTFKAVIPDIDRIKALGADIIWLMPIHPIGVVGKKGSLGCPYSISDYRGINPAYGTLEDFTALVDEIHSRGMKCIIDVVYNHTSHDSVLLNEHPEYFYRKPDGNFGNKCGEWADVYDLDYNVHELWDYQIDTLKMWAEYVDGFRCDVASNVPAEFWIKARAEVAKVRKDCIWLAESIHSYGVMMCRAAQIPVASDNELYEAFDMEYQYDIIHHFNGYIDGKVSLGEYLTMLNLQEIIYPANYIKMRFLENHDTPRICSRIKDEIILDNWLAFMYYQKGSMLIHAGQEFSDGHTPSLFEYDTINRDGRDISGQITNLSIIKKKLPAQAVFKADAADIEQGDISDVVFAKYMTNRTLSFGIFCLKSGAGKIRIDIEDGLYKNIIDDSEIEIKDGILEISGKPVIVLLK